MTILSVIFKIKTEKLKMHLQLAGMYSRLVGQVVGLLQTQVGREGINTVS